MPRNEDVQYTHVNIGLAQFVFAFKKKTSWTNPDSIALMVMQSMLGSWNKDARGGKHMGFELEQRVGINEIAESMMAFSTTSLAFILLQSVLLFMYFVSVAFRINKIHNTISYGFCSHKTNSDTKGK